MNKAIFLLLSLLGLGSCGTLQKATDKTDKHVVTNPAPDYTGRIGCTAPLSPNQFTAYYNAFTNCKFDIQRETLLSDKCLTAAQIRSIVQLFDFEHSRLKTLKQLYAYCFDADNYIQLFDLLQFDYSQEELKKHITPAP